MRKLLSVALCASLLLGILPWFSPPAQAQLMDVTVSVSTDYANVGDTLTWTALAVHGMPPYQYAFTIYRNNVVYPLPAGDGGPVYSMVMTEPGAYKARVTAVDASHPPMVGSRDSAITAVSLRPAPVVSLVRASSGTCLEVTYYWEKEPTFTGWEVYRATAAAGPYVLARVTSAERILNYYLTPGTRYFFKVRGYLLIGGARVPYTHFSAAKSGVPVSKTVIASAEATGRNRIRLTWKAAPGASGYLVYRSSSPAGPYTALRTTAATALTVTGLSPGTSYWFKVQAYKRIYTTNYYGPVSGYRRVRTLP